MQPLHDALGQTAAAQDAVLGVVVRIRVLVEDRIVRVEIADGRGALVLDLNARAGAIEGDLRVGLEHHQTDDDHERGAGDLAMTEDRGETIQQVDLLPAR